MADRPTALGRRYAAAALEQATAEGAVEAWQQLLEACAQLSAVADFRSALSSPRLPVSAKLQLISSSLRGLGAPEPGPAFQRLLQLLLERGRMGEIGAVAAAFRELADAQSGRVRAVVTSAVELSEAEREALMARLGATLGDLARGGVTLEEGVDPEILAGLTVRVGDRITDATMRSRLERLRSALAGEP